MKPKNALFENQKLLLVKNLKEIQQLKNSVEKSKLDNKDLFKEFVLGIIEVLDTYEKVEESIIERGYSNDDNLKFIINRYNSVKKRLLKLLKKFGVTKLEFPDNRLLIGFCKVIDTEPDSKLSNDTIIEILRNGYIHGKELIREADVIIVKN